MCPDGLVGQKNNTVKIQGQATEGTKKHTVEMPKSKILSLLHGFFPQPIQSHSQNVLAWIVIIYKVWIVCLVFGYAPWAETLVTSDDETESNRSTSSSWDFGTPLARPKHFYPMYVGNTPAIKKGNSSKSNASGQLKKHNTTSNTPGKVTIKKKSKVGSKQTKRFNIWRKNFDEKMWGLKL